MPQPDSTAPVIDAIIEKYQHLEGALLPILHGVQQALGYIPESAHGQIAAALNISRAEVHGVISFYHDFKSSPAGKTVIKLCRAEACQSMGSNALAEKIKARLGLDWGETSADGRVTLEPVFCLGLCACAPAGMVNGVLKGRICEGDIPC